MHTRCIKWHLKLSAHFSLFIFRLFFGEDKEPSSNALCNLFLSALMWLFLFHTELFFLDEHGNWRCCLRKAATREGWKARKTDFMHTDCLKILLTPQNYTFVLIYGNRKSASNSPGSPHKVCNINTFNCCHLDF